MPPRRAGVPIHYRHRILAADFATPGRALLRTRSIRAMNETGCPPGDGRQRIRAGAAAPSGLETPSSLPPRQALFTHIEDRIDCAGHDRNKILIAIHPQQHEIWYWLIPFSNGRSSLGVVVPEGFLTVPRRGFRGSIARAGPGGAAAWELLPNAVSIRRQAPSAGIPPTAGSCTARASSCSAMPGEFLDPVFSSGVTIAMKSASLAVPLAARQLRGESVDWLRSSSSPCGEASTYSSPM